jgi:hypothetical protein
MVLIAIELISGMGLLEKVAAYAGFRLSPLIRGVPRGPPHASHAAAPFSDIACASAGLAQP